MGTGDGTAVVAAVALLPGVSSAEGDYDAAGAMTGICVRLAPGADPAAVEAAVRRVSNAHFDCPPGQERVRVVGGRSSPASEAVPDGAVRVPAARSPRPQILRTEVTTAGGEVCATVVLSARATSTGRSTSGVTGGGLARAVATATLRALEGLLPETVHLELEQVETQWSQDPVVLVRLSLMCADGAQQLTGAALVRQDETGAVVRAVLDAANRRVEALLA